MCTGERCGGNGPPVQGSALGKEGRKYGVGMGENCPFMHETTALKPTMDGVGMGENCHFMHETTELKPTMDGVCMGKNCPFMRETTALKPTMDGVGMGRNCPFMRGKRLLYPTNYWAEVPGSGGKTPPHYPIRPHVFQKRKK